MEDLDLSALVGTLVYQIRQRWPALDGLLVLLFTALASLVVVFASAPEEWKTKMAPRALRVFAYVAGGFSAAGYASGKMGKAMAEASKP